VNERCTDDELREIASNNLDQRVRSAATELLTIRTARRHDSRRAEQIKKLRWVIENAITKIEATPELLRKWETDDNTVAMPRVGDDERVRIRAIVREAMWLAATMARMGAAAQHQDFESVEDQAVLDILGGR